MKTQTATRKPFLLRVAHGIKNALFSGVTLDFPVNNEELKMKVCSDKVYAVYEQIKKKPANCLNSSDRVFLRHHQQCCGVRFFDSEATSNLQASIISRLAAEDPNFTSNRPSLKDKTFEMNLNYNDLFDRERLDISPFDLHRQTAKRLFSTDSPGESERRAAKTVNLYSNDILDTQRQRHTSPNSPKRLLIGGNEYSILRNLLTYSYIHSHQDGTIFIYHATFIRDFGDFKAGYSCSLLELDIFRLSLKEINPEGFAIRGQIFNLTPVESEEG